MKWEGFWSLFGPALALPQERVIYADKSQSAWEDPSLLLYDCSSLGRIVIAAREPWQGKLNPIPEKGWPS